MGGCRILVLASILGVNIAEYHRQLGSTGECNGDLYMQGIVYSLWGTVFALEMLASNQSFPYKFDWFITGGTMLAYARNEAIIPLDSDSDIYVMFDDENIHGKGNAILEEFRSNIHNTLEKHLETKVYTYWNTDAPDWGLLHLEAVMQKLFHSFC